MTFEEFEDILRKNGAEMSWLWQRPEQDQHMTLVAQWPCWQYSGVDVTYPYLDLMADGRVLVSSSEARLSPAHVARMPLYINRAMAAVLAARLRQGE